MPGLDEGLASSSKTTCQGQKTMTQDNTGKNPAMDTLRKTTPGPRNDLEIIKIVSDSEPEMELSMKNENSKLLANYSTCGPPGLDTAAKKMQIVKLRKWRRNPPRNSLY